MRKKLSIITMFMTILIIVTGCGAQREIEIMLTEFAEAIKTLDFETMSSKVNPQNQECNENINSLLEDADDPMAQYLTKYLKSNASNMTYDIKDTKITKDTALVKVDFKYVNAEPLFKATFAEFMTKSIGLIFTGEEPTDEESSKIFVETMKEQIKLIEQPMVDKSIELSCIKIDGNWYVDNLEADIINVIMSNMMSVVEDIDESINF